MVCSSCAHLQEDDRFWTHTTLQLEEISEDTVGRDEPAALEGGGVSDQRSIASRLMGQVGLSYPVLHDKTE